MIIHIISADFLFLLGDIILPSVSCISIGLLLVGHNLFIVNYLKSNNQSFETRKVIFDCLENTHTLLLSMIKIFVLFYLRKQRKIQVKCYHQLGVMPKQTPKLSSGFDKYLNHRLSRDIDLSPDDTALLSSEMLCRVFQTRTTLI